ncbi:MAG: glycosyltransferase family 4 protein [Candidatus Jordarchaeaceae archaeon]
MKICFLSPFEDSMQRDTGASVRIYNLAKGLAALGNDVELIMPSTQDYSQCVDGIKVYGVKGFLPINVLQILKNIFDVLRATALYFYDFGFVVKISRLLRDQDVVQIENPSSSLLLILLLKRVMKKPVIVDCHDVFQALRVGHTSLFRRILETFLEKQVYKNADLLLSVSTQERDCLVSFGFHNSDIRIIPNGVDIIHLGKSHRLRQTRKEYNLEDSRIVVFVGNLNYAPNQEAIQLLSSKIAPKVAEKIYNVKFLVLGKLKSTLELPGLVFTGFVENLADVLSISDVAVAPLFQGSGTRLKILDYFSCALPVVSTSKGAEGLNVINGEHLLIEDDIDEFAMKIIALLQDDKLRNRLGNAGRELVIKEYIWPNIIKKLNVVYRELKSSHTPVH